MGFTAITLSVASQRAFIVVSVYFVTDSVRKLSDMWKLNWVPSLILYIVSTCFKHIIRMCNNAMDLAINVRYWRWDMQSCNEKLCVAVYSVNSSTT